MDKKYIFIILLLLTVGFASVNTYLDLNGKVDMSLLESDLDVVFKEVLLNKDNSENTFIIEEGKSFIYSADDLTNINDKSELDYVVMNKSHQYDVEVVVSCTTDYEDNINYEGTLDNNELPLEKGILIEAGEIKRGNIITELIKESTSEESLVLKCTLNYIPVSRDTLVEDEEYLVSLDSGYEEKLSDIKVKFYEEYSKLPELTRNNYQFLGWYTEDDVKVDNNSLVKIKSNHTLHAKWENICEFDSGEVWTFSYTGSVQTFTVPCDGNYKLEVYGSVGGTAGRYTGGSGGYSTGTKYLEYNKDIYIVAGSVGYNGGGATSGGYGAKGGGATHIALTNRGVLKNYASYKDEVLIVAGGGGAGYNGSVQRGYGGAGGGATGGNGSHGATGGNQTSGGSSGGSFGQGGGPSGTYSSGGGGGWYGGGAGGSSGGGGGSGYIGGVDGGQMQVGVNSANGYAKITYLGD